MRRWRIGHAERVFVDTSASVALVSATDAFYSAASQGMRDMAEARVTFFTTNFIVAETHALVLRKIDRVAALQVLRELDAGSTALIRVSDQDERRGRSILEQYEDKDFSLTDAISFAVMERLALAVAFTFDRHFAQYGFCMIGLDG
jgi:predicted nucleic acid-binding protein